MNIRQWQGDFIEHFLACVKNQQRDYLLVATPGAGKTLPTLLSAKDLIERGTVQRVVIVVPTEYLKEQWARSAGGILELQPHWSGDAPEGRDYAGVVVTYQSLATQKEMHRVLCGRKHTMVVFDEIHHLGEGTWGEAAQAAFGPARVRLGLSGTPFRSDGVAIPFVRYTDPDEQGLRRCIFDQHCSYVQALRERIVREVYFPSSDGNIAWIGRRGEQHVTLAETLPRDLDTERMWTVLDPDGDWIRTMFEKANAKLSRCRETGHRDAGGLIIASDIRAAERMARVISNIAGERAMLVVSDHEEATTVDAFRNSTTRWLVAVKMVTEGVDVTRLRVLAYATDCKTELFFRQAVGRVVRKIEGLKTQPAYVLIPDHPLIHELALKITAEVEQVIREREEEEEENESREPGQSNGAVFQPLYAEAIDAGVIGNGDLYTPGELTEARDLMRREGLAEVHEEHVVKILRASRQAPASSATVEEKPELAYMEQERLGRDCNKKAYKRDRLLGLEPGSTSKEWIQMGGSGHKWGDIENLRRKDDWLNSELIRIANDRAKGQSSEA